MIVAVSPAEAVQYVPFSSALDVSQSSKLPDRFSTSVDVEPYSSFLLAYSGLSKIDSTTD